MRLQRDGFQSVPAFARGIERLLRAQAPEGKCSLAVSLAWNRLVEIRILYRWRDVKIEDTRFVSDFLVIVLRQTFANYAREIRILVRSACAFVDQAALLEFAEWQPRGGDGVILIKHFVRLSIQRMRQSHGARNLAALGSNACGAVARKGIVPSWILAQSVDGVYVFAKSLARLRRGS